MSRKPSWVDRCAAVMVVIFGFMAAAAAMPVEPAATLVQPLPVGQPAPVQAVAYPAPVLYIKNIDHLAEVVKSDDLLHARTKALVAERNQGLTVVIVSLAVGAALMVAGLTAFANEECTPSVAGGSPHCMTMPSFPVMAGGVLVAGIGTMIGAAMGPSRHTQIDVVNEWNARHADRPIMLDAPRPTIHHRH